MPTTPTLAQVNAAMKAVTDAKNDMDLPGDFSSSLDNLSNLLQEIQNAVIAQTEQDLVNALAADNDELQALNTKICELSKSLDCTADTIQSVSSTVGTIASIIGSLI